MADALTLDSVSKAFGGLQVIEDLSFSVPRGKPDGVDWAQWCR